jgi:hypothetical protein
MATIVSYARVYSDAALERHPYFSWGAALAGAIAGFAVTFMLLALGTGLGLTLAGPVSDPAMPLKSILTLGGIYFFAVQAFGFAVGGYIAGRLCGPVLQSRGEEIFRSSAHGLVVWAVAVAAGVIFLLASAAVAANTAGNLAAAFGMSPAGARDSGEVAPGTANYWADTLLRTGGAAPAQTAPLPQTVPVTPSPADEARGTPGIEVTPVPSDQPGFPPEETAPSDPEPGVPAPSDSAPPSNNGGDTGSEGEAAPGDEPAPPSPSPALYVPGSDAQPLLRTIQYEASQYPAGTPGIVSVTSVRRVDPEAREEVARVLAANALALDKMPAGDRAHIEQTIADQTGARPADARGRLDGLIARVRDERAKAAEIARKAAAYINVWLGLSLLFGLLVATAAAVLARWEDEDTTEATVVRVEPVASA